MRGPAARVVVRGPPFGVARGGANMQSKGDSEAPSNLIFSGAKRALQALSKSLEQNF
jgi:hypothetical protein